MAVNNGWQLLSGVLIVILAIYAFYREGAMKRSGDLKHLERPKLAMFLGAILIAGLAVTIVSATGAEESYDEDDQA